MTAGVSFLLLILDLAALAVLRRRLREKKRARTVVTVLCVLLAIALAGYLALTALLLNGAYHN